MFSVIRRAFASTAHELGAEIGINSLKSTSSGRFFKLEEIFDFDAIQKAPEGSIVVDLGTKTQFQKTEELVQELIKSNGLIQSQTAVLAARIDRLEADVRILKLIPAAMQICETMKNYQIVLIHEFLPDILTVLSERDKKFSFLKGKPSSLIKKFFKRPIVVSLDNFILTKEFKKILEFRNLRAHEAMSDIDLLSDNFDGMIEYFGSISKDFDNASLNFDYIREVNELVQKIEQKNNL